MKSPVVNSERQTPSWAVNPIHFRSRWIAFWSLLLMGLDWVLRFLIARVFKLKFLSPDLALIFRHRLSKPQLDTGKKDRVETLHPTQNLLLHLPRHLTSEIFYSLSFHEQNHNKKGIWPFSSLFPFHYSWSLQSSAKHYLKPHSKVLITL